MKSHLKPIGKSFHWFTPKYILDRLGGFDLDPCSEDTRPWDTAKLHFTPEINGLKQPWNGRVWLNPPFHRTLRPDWMKLMSEHNNGIMLIPASTETDAFKKYVYGINSGILFLDHRPYFYNSEGVKAPYNCGCSICLIAYGERNMEILKQSGLGYPFKEKRAG